jgi:hypothetical protein
MLEGGRKSVSSLQTIFFLGTGRQGLVRVVGFVISFNLTTVVDVHTRQRLKPTARGYFIPAPIEICFCNHSLMKTIRHKEL